MGRRINTIMQTCFFAISGILPRDEAIEHIKKAIEKTYGKRGPEVVRRNCEVVDQALAHLHEIPVPAAVERHARTRPPLVSEQAPDFVQKVTAVMLAGKGDLLPVSAFPGRRHLAGGHREVGEAQPRARDPGLGPEGLHPVQPVRAGLPARRDPRQGLRRERARRRAGDVQVDAYKGNEYKGKRFTIQVAPEDCTGCNLCVNVCPAKDRTNPKHKAIDMHPQAPLRDAERANYDFFLDLPEIDRGRRSRSSTTRARSSSSRCSSTRAPARAAARRRTSSCSRSSSATACSSPTPPAARRSTAATCRRRRTRPTATGGGRPGRTRCSRTTPSSASASGWRSTRTSAAARGARRAPGAADRRRPGHGAARRGSVERGRHRRAARARRGAAQQARRPATSAEARRLETLADYLVKKSVWLVGGDGWAYDIGYGGLDHVLANRRDVNILVLDTEVYSNTGGQASKATPLGAAAKFAAAGKPVGKKDLGLLANMYGHVYVAQRRLRRQDGADGAGVPRGRVVPRAVADHRLQPLHRPRLRHGAGRVAAEAGGRLRRLAALPLRSAAPREGRAAAAPRLRPAEGARSPTTCATSRASGWSSAPTRPATRRSSRSRRRRPSAATPSTSSSRGSRCPSTPSRADDDTGAERRRRRRSDGPQHDLSRDAPAASADRRRRAARRRPRHRARRSRTRARPLLVLRSLYEEEITGEQMDAFFNSRATATRSPRRTASRPSPTMALGPDEYLEHLRRVKAAVGIPVMASLNGVTPGGWIVLRAAARAGRRRRARAAHLSRRQRHDAERRRRRAAGRSRSCAR